MKRLLPALPLALLSLLMSASLPAQDAASPPARPPLKVRHTLAATQVAILPAPKGNSFEPLSITCMSGDQISWRNETRDTHELGVINSSGEFVPLVDAPMKPGAVSMVFSPSMRFDAKDTQKQIPYRLTYGCKLHPKERGTIVVNPNL